ncbi:penicillin-binding protein 2 [Candidatus Parcubacteria bacterium]|nr:penicillin-binding protein 2 [Candidatus Parcubacteria bacterium]
MGGFRRNLSDIEWSTILGPLPRQGNRIGSSERRVWSLLPFYLLALLFFLALTGRLFELAVVGGANYLALSEGNRVRIQILRAERGVIYDRERRVLARNVPGFRVSVDLQPEDSVDDLSAEAEILSEILGISADEVLQKMLATQLISGLDRDEALKVELAADQIPHLTLEMDPQRWYERPEAFAHALGYTGEISGEELVQRGSSRYFLGDRVGRSGLESFYERYLHGTAGSRILESDASGGGARRLYENPSSPGQAIVTTLDASLQEKSFEALSKAVHEKGATGGAVVAQDPRTGEVLALVSYPPFDANIFSGRVRVEDYQELSEDPQKPLFNRALSGLYPPGSTFKIVTAVAALEEGVIGSSEQILDEGGIAVGSFFFPDWKEGGHGLVDLRKAIAESCDTYFYIVGGGFGSQPGLGVERLSKWARLFGLGQTTGIDLVGEAGGLVPDEAWKRETRGEPWYIGNTYHMAIGQADLLVTPLQLNNLTSVIANGGTLFQPFLVQRIEDGSGRSGIDFNPRVLRQDFIAPENLREVAEGMRAAVLEGGTAYPLRTLQVSSAGKTGTAEFGLEEGGSYETHAWFTCFAPYEEPRITLTVFLEGGGEGSDDAGPVAREILEWYFGQIPSTKYPARIASEAWRARQVPNKSQAPSSKQIGLRF